MHAKAKPVRYSIIENKNYTTSFPMHAAHS